MEKLYINDGLTYQEIADRLNYGYGKIAKWIHQYGIKPRSTSEYLTGRPKTKEHRQKLSESKKGKKNHNFGKKRKHHGKRCWYKCPNGETVSMRSRWEVAFAHHLTSNGTDWEYEPKTFLLEDGSAYTPDFYLIEQHEFIEIKGWMTECHQRRIEDFRHTYPTIKLTVLRRPHLQKLGIDLMADYDGCEAPKICCEQCEQMCIRKEKGQRFCGIRCRNQWLVKNRGNNKLLIANQETKAKRKYNGNQRGDYNNGGKLTSEEVLEIRRLWNGGKSVRDIQKTIAVSTGNFYNIIHRKSWKHI